MSFLRILGQRFFILWFALRQLLLFPTVQFLSSARHMHRPAVLFSVFAVALFLLSIIHPFLWWCSLLLFWLCLGLSLLNRQIHRDKKAVIEDEITESESHWLSYEPTLTFGVRFVGHIFLLLSLVQILRQSALFWGEQLFETSNSSPFVWVFYVLDLFGKVVLFDLPKTYGLEFVSVKHIGFWGAALVFSSRFVILALILGAFLRWRELYQIVKAAMLTAKVHPDIALAKLRAILKMYPKQITRFCLWAEEERWPRQSKAVLLETLGSCQKEEVLEVLKKHFREQEESELGQAVLRGMAAYGKGPLPLLRGLFFQSSVRASRSFRLGKQDRFYSDIELSLREEACRTLGVWNTLDSLSLLSQVAEEGDTEKVRVFAIEALGESQSQSTLPLLLQLMRERRLSEFERFAAKDAILKIGYLSKHMRNRLQGDLQLSQHSDHRRFSAIVLGELLDHQSFFIFSECLQKESDFDVQMHLLEGITLCLLHKPEVVVLFAEEGKVEYISKLFHWIEDAMEKGEKSFVRIAAIHAYASCSLLEKLGIVDKEKITLRLCQLVDMADREISDAAGYALESLLGHSLSENFENGERNTLFQRAASHQSLQRSKTSMSGSYSSVSHLSALQNDGSPYSTSSTSNLSVFEEPTAELVEEYDSDIETVIVGPLVGIDGLQALAQSVMGPSIEKDEAQVFLESFMEPLDQDDEEEVLDPEHHFINSLEERNSGKAISLGFPDWLSSLYRPERLVLHGSYASVWYAHSLDEEKEVALKISHSNDPKAEQVVHREYKVLERFSNLGVVPLLNSHHVELPSGGQSSFVMPWLGEETLFHQMKAKKEEMMYWNLKEVSFLLKSLCQTVYELHEEGWFHGDLKPENIFWLDGEVILCDFEVAQPFKTPEDLGGLSLEELPQGTPYYMAPEQLQEGSLDQRVDIYALGTLTYELLAGFLPQGSSPPMLSDVRSELSLGVEMVIAKATAYQPSERYDCPLAFWKELSLTFGDTFVGS